MELRELADLVDVYVDLREARLKLEREADKIKDKEVAAKAQLLETLREQGVGGVAGKRYRATLVTKEVPQVMDWDRLYDHIRATGEFEFLQRRLSGPAVRERWENSVEVPGVGPVEVTDLSINIL